MKTNNNTTRLNCLILLPFLGQKPQKQIEAEIDDWSQREREQLLIAVVVADAVVHICSV